MLSTVQRQLRPSPSSSASARGSRLTGQPFILRPTRIACQAPAGDSQPVAEQIPQYLPPQYAYPQPPEAVQMMPPPPGAVDPRMYMMPPPPGAQQYYGYQGVPGYPPMPVPVERSSDGGGIPWFVYVGGGFLLANLLAKAQELMKKGPQQIMAEMAMKQMMGSMGAGAPGGAANPFAAGGMPPFGAAGGMPPFGAAGSPFAAGAAASPFAAGAAKPAVDISATAVKPDDAPKGDKFAARKTGAPSATSATAAPAAPATSSSAAAPPAGAAKPMDVVEPSGVKEPARGAASSGASSSAKSAGFGGFVDVSAEEASSSQQQGTAGAAAGGDASSMSAMMERMLRDPSMQKMLYPYLPEPMRNPDSIEWMLNNPEVRKQMEQLFAQNNVGMTPQMMEMMKGMDFSQDKVNQQFSELGLKPEDVISKVMADPSLAAGFSNPKVQQAIFDISQNPMNISKYQSDPEVMKVLEKVTEIFAPQVGQAQARQ